MGKLEIIDIIDHTNKYSVQRFVVLNRSPNFMYEREGKWLIAEDSGFFNFYYYDRPCPNWEAFAGRKFNIKMKDGSIEEAYGQWWDGVPEDYQGLVDHTAYGTPDPQVVASTQNYTSRYTYAVQQFDGQVYTRIRGRQMAFRIESDKLGVDWQLGYPRIDIRPDGRR